MHACINNVFEKYAIWSKILKIGIYTFGTVDEIPPESRHPYFKNLYLFEPLTIPSGIRIANLLCALHRNKARAPDL
jgi:hypothetical protein